MTATMWGADVQALRDCAGVFESEAQRLQGSIATVDAAFQSAPWEGADRDQFAGEWAQMQARLDTCALSLVRAGGDLRRNADEQDQASNDGGTIGGDGPGPGPTDPGDGSPTMPSPSIWDRIKDFFSGVAGIFGAVVDWLEAAGKEVWKWAKVLGRTFAWLGGIIGIFDIGQFLWNGITKGEWNWGQLVEGLLAVGVAAVAIIGAIVGAKVLVVIGIVGGIALGLHSLAKLIFGADYLTHVWDGIKSGAEWAWDGITDAASWVGDRATDFGEWAWGGITDGYDWVGEQVGNARDTVVDTYSNVADGVSDFVGDVTDTVGDVVDWASGF